MNIQGLGAGFRSELYGRSETGQDAEVLGEGLAKTEAQGDELQDAFRQFVGTTFFGQMLASMRETVGEPAYFHGGRTEEIFQQQLDQIIVDDMTVNSAPQIADPMFELFSGRRS